MTPISRRGFVGIGAGLVAGAALPAVTPTTAAAAAATGTITDVKHVVILMQENRSFDHYFGRLRGVRGFADRAAYNIPGGWGTFNQSNWGGRQHPWKLSATPAAAWRGRRDPRPVQRRPPAQLDLAARRLEQGPDGQLGPRRRQHPHPRLPRPGRHTLPLRARRQLHGLRRLLLLHPQRHRPQPHLPVERQGRRGQQGRRRRVRAHLGDVRRSPPAGRDELEGLPERPGQLRRQRPGLLQEVHGRGPRQPAVGPGHGLGPQGHRLHPR